MNRPKGLKHFETSLGPVLKIGAYQSYVGLVAVQTSNCFLGISSHDHHVELIAAAPECAGHQLPCHMVPVCDQNVDTCVCKVGQKRISQVSSLGAGYW